MSELEPGVYIGLPPDTYFDQDRLGSSDFIKLSQVGIGWWWQSRWNPDREETPSEARNYGTALHSILLEGVDAYRRAFAVAPDRKDYVDLVDTVDEMKDALDRAGYDIRSGTSKWKKPDWAQAMIDLMPDRPCWSTILETFQAEAGSRSVVSRAEDRSLRLMRHVATDPARSDNAAVRRLFEENELHPQLVEVSILADVDGLRRRWRIDKMMPGADLDLKSLGAWRGRPLAFEIGDVAARRGWCVQRADYFDGRKAAIELIKEDRIFGGTLEQRAYLREIAEDGAPDPAWIWLCFQKPDQKGAAPILCPVWDNAESWLHQLGRSQLENAKRFYRRMVAEFGLEQPWARVEPLHFTDENAAGPVIRFPHWLANDELTEEQDDE